MTGTINPKPENLLPMNDLPINPTQITKARDDFQRARRVAAIQQTLAVLTGKSVEMLPYHEIREQLKFTGAADRGIQEIPVKAIVGSVGRYKDFTRTFLPTNPTDELRWAGVKVFMERDTFPPIEVYKLGDAYFVIDGNHRVSVARQMEIEYLPAKVIEVKTRVPLSHHDSPEQVICKSRYAEFLEATNLDTLRPGCNLLMTLCDQYDLLLSQIEVHRYFLWLDQQVELPRDAVIMDWYDHAYLPIVELIQAQGLLLDFPEQTETDLYMLITEHRLELQRQLGWQVDTPGVLKNLARKKSPRRGKRLGERFLQTLIPDAIKSGPQAGTWRQERLARRENTNLFADILVAGRGLPADWNTLDHAIRVAQREKARLLGLRVVPDPESDAWDTLESIKKEFDHRCTQAGVRAEATFEKGPVVPTIVQRSAWADLLVLSLVRQSGPETKIGVGSDFDLILQRSPRPVLVVPEGAESPLDRVVLAFDGSPKANEALYAAAYMVDQWRIDLVVINGGTSNQPGEALGAARDYLERRELPASFVYLQGSPAQVILDSAVIYESNLIIMGGYGIQPLAHLVVGSTVHAVLRSTNIPVLICR